MSKIAPNPSTGGSGGTICVGVKPVRARLPLDLNPSANFAGDSKGKREAVILSRHLYFQVLTSYMTADKSPYYGDQAFVQASDRLMISMTAQEDKRESISR